MALRTDTQLTDDKGTWTWKVEPFAFGVLSYERKDGPTFEVALQGDDFLLMDRNLDDIALARSGDDWKRSVLCLFDSYSGVMTARCS